MTPLDRRAFLAASAASVPLLSTFASAQQADARAKPQGAQSFRPTVIGSANGIPAIAKAMELMNGGSDPLDAIVTGINIVEDDPNDQSVGYGGLPNENGVVELDASVMHGRSHKAGAVAALQSIKNPSSVALQVLRRTDHVMLVGEGALKFAKAMGFKEENLLTEKSREAWLKWKQSLNANDDWLDENQQIKPGDFNRKESRARELNIPYTTGTIHCSGVDMFGNMAACTSTSGLSWKLAGRVGDSPIIGAGMFCDNDVGAAGATGRGEAVIQSCGAFQIVQHMANGVEPTEACLKVLQWIADHTKQSYLLDEKGRPNFGVTFYALRKDGAYGSATMRAQKDRPNSERFAIHDGIQAKLLDCAALFDNG